MINATIPFFKEFSLADGAFFFFVGMVVSFIFEWMRKNQNIYLNMAVGTHAFLAISFSHNPPTPIYYYQIIT